MATKWSGGDTDRFIIVKLDNSKYISGLDYTPVGGNGTMLACDVYVSQNGKNWTLATSVSGWGNNNTKKSLTLPQFMDNILKLLEQIRLAVFVQLDCLNSLKMKPYQTNR